MGFLKDLGHTVGTVAGVVVAAPVYLAGELVDSDFIKEVADTACRVTVHTGDLLGTVAEGTGKCIEGALNKDGRVFGEGLGEVVEAGVDTVVGMGKGMMHIAGQGLETAAAIANGDTETAIKTGKELAKVALVGTVAIGLADVMDGVVDMFDDDIEYQVFENENVHHVTPHWRTLPDGREIWVDGDGNTAINQGTGWVQSNPNYRVRV